MDLRERNSRKPKKSTKKWSFVTTTRDIKSECMRWETRVACIRSESCTILVGKSKRKRALRRTRHKWDDDNKI